MFLKYPFKYAKVEGFGTLFYPMVGLQIETIYGIREFEFLVDTGADITTLTSDILPLLNIDKNKLKTSVTLGVGGLEVKTYEFKFPLFFGKQKIMINATAVDTDGKTMPFLLGRKDIFESKFSLELDSKLKCVVIKENK